VPCVDTCDKYLLYDNTEMIPEEFETIEVGDKRSVCCETYNLTCSWFPYNRHLLAELSTGEWVTAAGSSFNSWSGLEFHHRIRCLGRNTFL